MLIASSGAEVAAAHETGVRVGFVPVLLILQPSVYHAKKQYFEKHDNIPLRLSPEERALLHVLEGSLNVSEYTDKVDVIQRWDKVRNLLCNI